MDGGIYTGWTIAHAGDQTVRTQAQSNRSECASNHDIGEDQHWNSPGRSIGATHGEVVWGVGYRRRNSSYNQCRGWKTTRGAGPRVVPGNGNDLNLREDSVQGLDNEAGADHVGSEDQNGPPGRRSVGTGKDLGRFQRSQ
jgi:hypothetical protein